MVITRTKFSTKKFSTFQFGTGNKLTVTINGIEKPIYDLSIEDVLTSEVNTCSFGLDDIYTNKPLNGQEVIITHRENGIDVRIFAGTITGVAPTKLQGTNFAFAVDCIDYTYSLDKLLVAEDYVDKTAYYIINDIITKYTTGYTITGVPSIASPNIASIQFNYVPVSECIRALADLTGYDWYVDYYKDIKFFALDTVVTDAPIELLDNGTEFDELELSFDNTQIRNRCFVRGGIYFSAEYTQDTITAVSGQTEFYTVYQPHELSVTVNAVTKTVGIENIDDAGGHDFLLNYDEKLLRTDTIVMAGGEAVIIKYKYQIPVICMVEDLPSQMAIKAIEGGTGIYETIVVDKNIETIEGARQRATAELLQYANTIVEGQFITFIDGFRSGQKIHIQLTDRNINEYYLIKSVTIESIGGDNLIYTVTFATFLKGFSWLLIKIFDELRKKEKVNNEIIDKISYIYDSATITDLLTEQSNKTPPFKWCNDIGTTLNKAIWDESIWANG